MKLRNPKITDAKAIHSLISRYAELDMMLFRSLGDIYENLQIFKVAEVDGAIVGCCALQIVWSDLAEIKSLAVDKDFYDKGIGSALVLGSLEDAKNIGIGRVFTLTLESTFFEKLGFKQVSKDTLPMKVWSDCTKCPKQQNCDEVALMHENQQ